MTTGDPITLIFDPFSIAEKQGERVSGLKAELLAFEEINDSLRRNEVLETVVPKVYIIPSSSIEHFRTYREVKGVNIQTVTPRSVIGELLQCEPPTWLTNEQIEDLHLLQYPAPESLFNDDWEATIASWLIPGIERAATLEQWLRIASSAEDRFERDYGSGPVSLWIQRQFLELAVATDELATHDFASSLQAELIRATSPVAFAKKWVRYKAILPLTSPALDNPIRIPSAGSQAISVRDRQLAGRLPLIFPLPSTINEDVSKLFCHAIRRSRLNEKHRLSEAVLSLNAIWPGVAEEIRTWLEIYPKGLNHAASQHLSKLQGFESNESIRKIVDRFRPPDPVPAWPGLTDNLEAWVHSYSKYIRSCFHRRDLNEADDPAIGFGRWLKDHATICFDHHRHSYFRVAQAVQQALTAERTVFLVMIDALPIHQSDDMIGFLSDNLGEQPTNSSCLFVPLPTVTEVCKEAILTGKLPSECRGDLKSQLQQRYNLSETEIHLSGNWKDAERFQSTAEIKLVVYRDNRLDDQLHKLASYSAMAEDSKAVFIQLSRLLKRWSDDVKCITQKPPLILVTADHGYTFGPSSGGETMGHRVLDGAHRCIVVDSPISDSDAADESITVIDKETFRLKDSYIAASGRFFGRGTMSGWAMSHGGLLPEEVIVPFVEWFGDEELTPWPSVSFPEAGYVDRGVFRFSVTLKNSRSVPTTSCTLRIGIAGEVAEVTEKLPAMSCGDSTKLDIVLPLRDTSDCDTVAIVVTMRAKERRTGELIDKCNDFIVPRKKLLVEKTNDQDDFENMF
ncbi:MAG TPA: hypothetical protein DDZ51_06175 [Planctomycetaceae bacterium]|nr:hypothetical protein [Planctomycetaceae bacterium]